LIATTTPSAIDGSELQLNDGYERRDRETSGDKWCVRLDEVTPTQPAPVNLGPPRVLVISMPSERTDVPRFFKGKAQERLLSPAAAIIRIT
jgi:hypothetical protein